MNSAKSKWRLAPLAVVIAVFAAAAAFLLGGLTLSPAPQPAAAVTQQEFTFNFAADQNADKLWVTFKSGGADPAALASAKVIQNAAGCAGNAAPGVVVAAGKVTVTWEKKCVQAGDQVILGVVADGKAKLWVTESAWFNGTTELPPKTSGITCTDVYLAELQVPLTQADPPLPAKPATLGDPPWEDVIPDPIFGHTAIALTRTAHDTTTNQVVGVTQAMNLGIPGAIAGTIPLFSVPKCATVDKVVATVGSVGGTETEPVLGISATEGNQPQPDMPVFWNTTGAQRGFYVVTSTDKASTATLKKTYALCNNPPAGVSDPGTLHSCIPVNKGFTTPPYAYNNAGVMVGGILSRPPFTEYQPRENGGEFGCSAGCTSEYDYDPSTHSGTSVSVSCAPGTGAPESETDPVGVWTRLESRTVSKETESEKVPSYGQTQYYTGVTPKTCANVVGVRRSTTVNVTWSVDSAQADGPNPATDGWDNDWDKDGCLDWQELASPKPVYQSTGKDNWKGGRDAFNPYDCQRNLEGIYSITATVQEITLGENKPGYTNVNPGAFYRCRAYMQHDKVDNSLTVPVYCYIDVMVPVPLQVNPEGYPGETGDGLGGNIYPIGLTGTPPGADGPYGDMDDNQTVLTGSYDPQTDKISIDGCFVDKDGQSAVGNVYVKTVDPGIDMLTGYGKLDIHLFETLENCEAGTPANTEPPLYSLADLQIGILAGKDPQSGATTAIDAYDFELDGCPDRYELGNDKNFGGLRDPFNRWDWFNPTEDGLIRVDDIIEVVNHYGLDEGDAGYGTKWDRGGQITGSHGWNQKPPNGQIRVADIIGVVNSYGANCPP